ncbi:variable large family protein [Borrelia hermsii]|uniref:Variable large protein n=3 Tax=Borrelia hermsii TaxID=140 RepID=Q1CNV6_BORHD|nr:variable large family protein [Borrelia hermsii]ABF82205.1 VlpA18D [Borrelia hermsii DAH]ABO85277.1 variable membrane protein [Borrelia hermsii]AMR76073.1 Variable large protein A18 [Borrelia hermsii]ANA43967.1 VlpA18 [Borrelia hermsii HS1]UPA08357.1 variable large family protein [Borrelia hermsii DAH]
MRKRISAIINKLNISIMMMIVVLMIGCGQQAVEAGKDGAAAATGGRSLSEVLMEVGKSAENAFYSFMALVSDTLGLRVTKDTKKNEVGGYFNSLGGKLGKASDELEEVAKKSEVEGAKDGPIAVAIRAAVDTAKTTLSTLKGHLESLKGIGDDKVVGWAENDQQGIKPADDGLNKFLNALQSIVKAATDAGVLAPKAGNTTLTVNGVDNKDGAKVLAIDKPGAAVGEKASLIVSAVSGEEILASIVASKEGDQALGAAADGTTTAMSFAKGGTKDNLSNANTPKAAAVAGGIALRSLVKDGKLASHNDNSEKAVQAAGVIAANKLLVSVEDLIKKTVKNVLEKAKEKIDKARAPKATGQQ